MMNPIDKTAFSSPIHHSFSRYGRTAFRAVITALVVSAALSMSAPHTRAMPPDYYEVEDIVLPPHVAPEVGGLAFNSKGELIVLLRRHGIIIGKPSADPEKFEWRQFTDMSLHNPMGILIESENSFLVPQMAELTRISDTDGDGVADLFETVSNEFGLSGNYHETTGGPVPDGQGNWFLAVGTASHNGPVFHHTQGTYSPIGRRGRNFSAVEYRGWVVKIRPDGSLIPWASGFRANNGIAMRMDDTLWVTDNQGDWRGTSPIYHIEKGNFYGHPSSLVWDENWTGGDPLRYPIDKLDAMRTRAAVLLPQGEMCNSPAEPIFDINNGRFGPFRNQMFVGDIAGQRILRIMLEEVGGQYQGACIKFVENSGLRGGNNRFTWSPDGSTLYVGQTYRGWGRPEEGLQRIRFTGKVPFEVHDIRIQPDGFILSFTHPVDAGAFDDVERYQAQSWHYDYGFRYGSPKRDVKSLPVTSVSPLADGRSVRVTLDGMEPRKIIQLELSNLNSRDGLPLIHGTLCYTCNIIPE